VQVCQYCTGVTRLILDGNMQRIFFGQLSLMETQKVVERLINYVLFKGLFLTWVVRPELMQIAVWLAWFAILGCIKVSEFPILVVQLQALVFAFHMVIRENIAGCVFKTKGLGSQMFQGLARDRLVRLDASPTATMLAHIRVFAVLVLVLLFDLVL
jgi:autocrine motility factor receptor